MLGFSFTDKSQSVALRSDHVRIVEESILGSILVNLLPVLGTALLAGSMCGEDSVGDNAEAQLLAALLFVSIFVFLMPVRSLLPSKPGLPC